MATFQNETPYLPPRRPKSTSDLKAQRSLKRSAPNHFPPQQPQSALIPPNSRSASLRRGIHTIAEVDDRHRFTLVPITHVKTEPRPCSIGIDVDDGSDVILPEANAARPVTSVCRHSSLRFESSLSKGSRRATTITPNASYSRSDLSLERPSSRPRSHPSSTTDLHSVPSMHSPETDLWPLPPLPQPSISRSSSTFSKTLRPKPKTSFTKLQSLDSLITYREQRAEWKRASSILQSAGNEPEEDYDFDEREPTVHADPYVTSTGTCATFDEKTDDFTPRSVTPYDDNEPQQMLDHEQPKSRFRHFAAEVGFCFTIAMTQFLAEYMISGFAIELPKIMTRYGDPSAGPSSMGMFWPASLLSLILSATLLIFARISDMYGGYLPFMFGVIWLGIWSLLAGFAQASVLLDISRAMQGLAIAAFIPSTFAMIGSIYPEGPRKNLVLGLYAGCAPLGFFAGFLTAGALPVTTPGWYFWIAAILSFITAITAYLTVPNDRTNRQQLGLKMDCFGAFLITGGLVLLAYALAVQPYAGQIDSARSGWTSPMVLAPLLSGLGCLVTAIWVEGWRATCPLLPFDFFYPKSVKAFSLACLCFYASYGVWLYESAQYFASPTATGTEHGIEGLALASWYTPTAVGGIVLCVIGGSLIHIVPVMVLLILSGLAWVGAPLLLALCPLPLNYWGFVMPSMVCATIGIDLTFTVSTIFLSSISPLRYQGLAGAISSILVNLAMSFSLSISEIVAIKAQDSVHTSEEDAEIWGFEATFIYAAASAGLGLMICVLFVRISRKVVQGEVGQAAGADQDEERAQVRPRATSSEASTLVDVSRAA